MTGAQPILKLSALLLWATLISPPTFAQGPQRDGADARAVILKLEDQFADASARGDGRYLEDVLSDDYVGIVSTGHMLHKADVLAAAREQATSNAEPGRVTNQDLVVRVYGNTAVVTGTVIEEQPGEKAASVRKLYFTDVWVRTGDRWKVVSTQGTRAAN
jgi:ketosteroid isomerase-like protein